MSRFPLSLETSVQPGERGNLGACPWPPTGPSARRPRTSLLPDAIARSSRRRPGIRVALGLPSDEVVTGPRRPRRAAPPSRNRSWSARSAEDACLGDRHTRHLSQLPALFRHPPPRAGARRPNRAVAARPPGRLDHDDLPSRPAPRRPRSPEPLGHPLSRITPRPLLTRRTR